MISTHIELPEWMVSLIDKANRLDVECCFLREPHVIVSDAMNGPDVDIWVDQDSSSLFFKILTDAGWRVSDGSSNGRFQRGDFAASIKFVYTYEKLFRPVLDIHVGALKWRSFTYLPAKMVHRSIYKTNNVRFITGAAMLSILTHRVILRGKLRGGRLQRARRYYASVDSDERIQWAAHTERLFGRKASAKLEDWMRGVREPGRHSHLACRLKAILRNPVVLIELMKKCGKWCRRYMPFRQCVTICFLGPDGSGKSTAIKSLRNRLEKAGHGNKVYCVYWGRARGNTHLLSTARSLINAKMNQRDISRGMRRTLEQAGPFRLINIAAIAYLLDYWCRYLTQIFSNLLSSTHVLVDRGPLDIATMPGKTSFLTTVAKLCPRFDVAFYCHAPVGTILSRKRERTADEIKRQQAVFKELVRRLNCGLAVNTNAKPKQVLDYLELAIQFVRARKNGNLDHQIYALVRSQLSRMAYNPD